jgi:hypothetical protein
MKKAYLLVLSFCCQIFLSTGFTQGVDHWETIVQASDYWKYHVGNSEPASGWHLPTFDDSNWEEGPGGFGYGDDDDQTFTPVLNAPSVYIRIQFELVDLSQIEQAVLHLDYDDAFVAYLNGTEIARDNVEGMFPPFNAMPLESNEAQLYQGNQPPAFTLSKEDVEQLLTQGLNTLAIQVHNDVLSSDDMSSNVYFSVGVNDESINYQETPEWFILPLIDSNLPIVIITTNGEDIVDEPKITAHMGIIDNGLNNRNRVNIDTFNGYNGHIGIELRGASSQVAYPKPNYGFETRDDNGDNNNVELLGMPEENDWVLYGPYVDKTMMRNVFTFHLGRLMDQWAPRARYCEVIVDSTYMGVYVLMEKIKRDKNRVDISKLKEDDNNGDQLTGGYIVQVDRVDDGNHWVSEHDSNHVFVYHDPKLSDMTLLQQAYIRQYISDFEDVMASPEFNDPEEGYKQYIDIESFVDHMLAVELTKNVDGFRFSSFLHKDRDSKGGKLKAGPLWDYNLAFGNAYFCEGFEMEGWVSDFVECGEKRPKWWNRLLEDEAFVNQMKCRWEDLRSGPWQTDSLMEYIDEQVAILDEAHKRQFARWPESQVANRTFEWEINKLKTWTTSRLEWMDMSMPGECIISTIEEEDSYRQIVARPNPFSEGTEFIIDKSVGDVTGNLQIFDAYGTMVNSIELNETLTVQWDGSDTNGNHLSNGLFFFVYSAKGTIHHSGKLLKL